MKWPNDLSSRTTHHTLTKKHTWKLLPQWYNCVTTHYNCVCYWYRRYGIALRPCIGLTMQPCDFYWASCKIPAPEQNHQVRDVSLCLLHPVFYIHQDALQFFAYLFMGHALATEQGERPAAAHLLKSWVRIPPGAWIFVCCECRVLSGRGLCDELITRPEESFRLCWVVVCNLETSRIGAPYI